MSATSRIGSPKQQSRELQQAWRQIPETESIDWTADVHAARLAREPLRARALLYVTTIAIVVLLVWAALAQIDEVTRGEARVVPSRQLQILQALDGGIVSEILVREGQIVEPGQILVRIDATRFVASLRENHAQRHALLGKAARLAALADNAPLQLPDEILREAPDIAAAETQLFYSSLAELEGQISIARDQLAQRQQELAEATAFNEQAIRAHELAARELYQTEPLLETGAVSEVEVLRLQREVSRLRGDLDQSVAQVTRSRAAIAEGERKVAQVELDFRNTRRTELADISATLSSLSESSLGLSDRVTQADVRSPVRGTVNRLLVNTEGGVVLPGRDVVEIVPLDDTLLLEARITPRDIAFLRPGQPALVKFTAYDFLVYGGLDAVVESIGVDTITDEAGTPFYLVRVRTHEASIGADLPIIPGMVAEINVLTGRKSILTYLMKPVLRAKQNALTER